MPATNKIGVIVECFRLSVREGLRKAREVGAQGVQLYGVGGEMDPAALSASARKELKVYIEDLGLEVTAVCGDMGGHGFQDATANPSRVEKSKRILDLALDLGASIVTTHIGIIPERTDDPVYEAMWSACREIGEYAAYRQASFAIETGPETAAHLKRFLDHLETTGVAVNFDPANFVMVTGEDPVAAVGILKDRIVHTHAKDGVRYKAVDPRYVYGYVGLERETYTDILKGIQAREYYREMPLGDGAVEFPAYFDALRRAGYTGYLTIEREVGDDPESDIRRAVQFLAALQR